MRSEYYSVYDGRYGSFWPFMSSQKGVWYYFGIVEENWFNTLSIITADYDKHLENDFAPFWITDKDILSNLKPLIVYEEYKRDFENIIKFLLQQSPENMVMFLCSYQGGETEIIEGVLKYEIFADLLRQQNILFNVAYIISG